MRTAASVEWYTPSLYIEAARAVMGAIDLDPASCAFANTVVQATQYFDTDGLSRPWHGRLWMNPPYGYAVGKNCQAAWTAKLIEEYDKGNVVEAIALCDSRTDTRWFHALFTRFPICFVKGRISFYTETVTPFTTHMHGSAFIYLGQHEQAFFDQFSSFGCIVKAVVP